MRLVRQGIGVCLIILGMAVFIIVRSTKIQQFPVLYLIVEFFTEDKFTIIKKQQESLSWFSC